MDKRINLLIVGSGPAGLTAAIYAARAGLKPVVASGDALGGLLTETSFVENFPGFPEPILGAELMDRMQQQALRLGAEVLYDSITSLKVCQNGFEAVLAGGEILQARAVVIATGAKHRELGLPEESRFKNKGLSYCAICDGHFYKGKTVTVVGGGDVALEEALYLSTLAPKVHIVHRRSTFRASCASVERAMNANNIQVHWNSTVKSVRGNADGYVSGVELEDVGNGLPRMLDTNGLFVAIGLKPDTSLVKPLLQLDGGYIRLPEPNSSMTEIPGLFAAGDCVDKVYRQAITAAAMGCKAGIDASKWLKQN